MRRPVQILALLLVLPALGVASASAEGAPKVALSATDHHWARPPRTTPAAAPCSSARCPPSPPPPAWRCASSFSSPAPAPDPTAEAGYAAGGRARAEQVDPQRSGPRRSRAGARAWASGPGRLPRPHHLPLAQRRRADRARRAPHDAGVPAARPAAQPRARPDATAATTCCWLTRRSTPSSCATPGARRPGRSRPGSPRRA